MRFMSLVYIFNSYLQFYNMITKLKLQNWKSHLDSEFNFDKGVNILIGVMGSGKSSLVQAISFALYGTFPAHQSKTISLEDLIMKKPDHKKHSKVELEFQLNGDTYSIKRVVQESKGTTEAEIRKNNEVLDVNPQGVTRAVEKILQMDYDLFSKAVYSEQNAIDYFLNIPKGQRTKHIDRMLKVDRFEKVREHVVSITNKIKSRREEKVRIIHELEKEDLGTKRDVLEKELKKLESDLNNLKSRIDVLTDEKEKIAKQLSELEDKEARLKESEKELSGISAGLKEIESALKKKIPKDLEKQIKEVQDEIGKLEKELEKKNKSIDNERSKVAEINSEIRLITESVVELEKLGAKCPTCEADITDERKSKLISEKKVKESGLRKRLNDIVSGFDELKKNVDELDKSIRKRIGEKEQLVSLQEEVENIKKMEKRQEDYIKRKMELENSIKELKGIDIKPVRELLQKKVAEESKLLAEINAAADKIGLKRDSLNELGKRLEMLKRYRKEVEADEKSADDMQRFNKVLKLTQDQLREEFVKTVNSIMSEVWQEIYPYGDFDDIRLEVDNDYTLQLKGLTGWVPVEGMVSGGERSMAALALRIAFSLAFIPNLRWLILDEPTHNLDINAIERFSEILRDKMHVFAEQVFLITHEERISDGATGALYKLERDKAKNEPSRVLVES